MLKPFRWRRACIIALGLSALPIAFAHWYAVLPIPNPVPVVGSPTTQPVSTVTQWYCVTSQGQTVDGPYSTSAAVEQPCGQRVAADGNTRFIEERVTTTSSVSQITRTQRSEVVGSTQMRVSEAAAQMLIQRPGGGGAPEPPAEITNTCTYGDDSEPEPFDLSAYDFSFFATGTCRWPDPPVTTTSVVVETCAEFQAADDDGATLITIPAGITIGSEGTPCNINITGDDTDIVMADNSTLIGAVAMDHDGAGRTNRVRWTGGSINGAGQLTSTGNRWWVAPTDVLFDGVYCECAIWITAVTGTPGFSRIAFINSTIDQRQNTSDSYGIMMQQDPSLSAYHQDFIMANVSMHAYNHTSIRNQQLLRSIFVESVFRHGSTGSSYTGMITAHRFGEDSRDAFVGGIPEKRTLMLGRMYWGYVELLPEPAITNVVVDGVDLYWKNQSTAFVHLGFANTGVVRNFSVYNDTGVGGQPTSISPFTTDGGIDNIVEWVQDVDAYPNTDAYGASHACAAC